MYITELREQRAELVGRQLAIVDAAKRATREHLTARETAEFHDLTRQVSAVDEKIDEAERAGQGNPAAEAVRRASFHASPDGRGGGSWATRAATAITRMGGVRAAPSSAGLSTSRRWSKPTCRP